MTTMRTAHTAVVNVFNPSSVHRASRHGQLPRMPSFSPRLGAANRGWGLRRFTVCSCLCSCVRSCETKELLRAVVCCFRSIRIGTLGRWCVRTFLSCYAVGMADTLCRWRRVDVQSWRVLCQSLCSRWSACLKRGASVIGRPSLRR